MTNLDQIQTIDDYFAVFSSFHVRKAAELLDPLHVPGRDPLADFSDMFRQPFEAQAHVATAAIKMLDETRRGVIAAECGCIAGESEVYDPVARIYHRVDQITEPFHVVAYHEGMTVVEKARVPFVKGRRDLYRVRLSNGQSFVSTDHHRILTDHGWLLVREADALLRVSSPVLLLSMPDTFPLGCLQGADRLSRIPRDCRDRCSQDHGLCDGQPLSATDTDRESALPQDDVLAPDLCDLREDGLDNEPEYIPSCPRSALPSTRGSSLRATDIHETSLERHSSSELGEPFAGPGRDDRLSLSATSRHRDTTSSCHRRASQFGVACPHSTNECEFVTVISILYERTDTYYDFTVEQYHNYFMAGIVHHNTGKTLIGMLAIHKHAQRSVRKGGCNGNYRAIALVPGHLRGKWRDELEETLPGVKVTLLDTAGKGCKQALADMNRLYLQMRGPNGRWRKPQGAEWYIIGRDESKLAPARSGLGNKRRGFSGRLGDAGSSRRFLVELEGENGTKRRVEARRWVCPACGKPIVDKNGAPINVPKSTRLLTCDGKFGRDLPELDRKECGLDRSQWRKELAQVPAGRVIEQKGKRWRICECKEPLWQFTAKPKRWPPAVFIAKKMPGAFRYLIVDEFHEFKSDQSGQASACGKLMSSTRYCLGMTGTLIGGYADHLFPLLFRMSADRLLEEGFEWGKSLAFTERYGRIERIVTTKECTGEVNLTTSNRSMRRERSGQSVRKRSVPGVMPALFARHLADRAIFLALDDVAESLPKLREYVGGEFDDPDNPPDYDADDLKFWTECRVPMAPEQQREYKRVEEILVSTCRDLLQHGSMKLLGAMLVTLLEYPDRPWDWTAPTGNEDHLAVGYWKTGSKTADDWEGVVQPRTLDESIIYPKEQALLEICRREVQAGNQVWTFVQMTGKRDIQPRLKRILTEAGFRVSVMRSKSVKTRDRLDWIKKEGKRADIVISHPQLVQTGLDFFGKGDASHNFSSLVFFQTGYNPFTMQQAARRSWRIGQTRDCRTYFLHYQGTMQQRAMALMARKLAAMMALDGRLSVEGLAGMADNESAAMALARSISNAIDTADIQRNWVKVTSTRKPTPKPLISFGQALLEDDPIDGLDILSIEPHLIAQTILDNQDEVGEIKLSRDVLARMLEDFDSIEDDELDVLCTA